MGKEEKNSARRKKHGAPEPCGERAEEETAAGEGGPGTGHAEEGPFIGGRTPLFHVRNSPRHERQDLIRDYREITGANLITFISRYIDQADVVLMEEVLHDCSPEEDLHVLLASPGGDGEVALRMLKLMRTHCRRLTILVPDIAKSAATIICLGADEVIMGPAGDLGPVDPQMETDSGEYVAAKDIVSAVEDAESRVTRNLDTYPVYSTLLSGITMLLYERAISALQRSQALTREALKCVPGRGHSEIKKLTRSLTRRLIDEPSSHAAAITAEDALQMGLPVSRADVSSRQWQIIWVLYNYYYMLGAFPAGNASVFEGYRVSIIDAHEDQMSEE